MTKENLLAIDIGTQSARALVFGSTGNLLDMGKAIYLIPYNTPKPGYAEQDADFYFEKVIEACSKLWKKKKITPDSIAGICVTTQRGTVVNLDKNKKPLRPAITWLDQRISKNPPPIKFPWNKAFSLPGLKNIISYLQAEAEINWIYENQRDIWEKTEHFLMLSGYINYRITGEIKDSIANQVGYIPFDYKRHKWPSKNHWRWDVIKAKPGTLPDLIAPGKQIGVISREASDLLGLDAGVPVIAGASDKACEVLGSGCIKANQACIGFGTTATINVNSKKYIEPLTLIPPYPSAEQKAYNLEIQTFRGFWMVTWFKEQFAHLENQSARELGISAEELLEELASKVPPGSLGLTLQPYWSPGLRYPGPEAKGSIIGFGSVHQRQHMYRALLEGLVYAKRHGKERIEKKTKIPINEIYICGGGSKSDLVMQIAADIFNLETIRPEISETSGLGAAILAAVGTGIHKSVNEAVKEMSRKGAVFIPDQNNVPQYNELYNEVYLKQYQRLRPLYRSIRKITGYPE